MNQLQIITAVAVAIMHEPIANHDHQLPTIINLRLLKAIFRFEIAKIKSILKKLMVGCCVKHNIIADKMLLTIAGSKS